MHCIFVVDLKDRDIIKCRNSRSQVHQMFLVKHLTADIKSPVSWLISQARLLISFMTCPVIAIRKGLMLIIKEGMQGGFFSNVNHNSVTIPNIIVYLSLITSYILRYLLISFGFISEHFSDG